MAAIRYKELLGWYVITLKLRGTVESRLPKKSTYAGEIVPDHELRSPKSEWVISIEEKLAQGRQDNMPGSWAELSIYRIPCYLKNGEDKTWVPQIVSLGPYHHGEEHLLHMEQHKWRCLHRILKRSGQVIALYLESVKKVEQRARAYYEGRISMSCNKFVEMMVLDGCFVIEMFRGFAKGFTKLGYPPNDPVFSMRRSILQIQWDMIMLENQIPLFILDQLLGLQLGDPNQKGGVTELALQVFGPLIHSPMNPSYRAVARLFDPLYDHEKVHCLAVVWRSILPLGPKRPNRVKCVQNHKWPTLCLSKLQEAGIQIWSIIGNSWGHILFKRGILFIPSIEIHEGTRLLLLNLIAFEQSHSNCNPYVTSYVIFMHNLISTPEDVFYLRNQNIINHCLASDAEVADLFHRLCQEVAFEDSYLSDVYKELNEYYHWGFNFGDAFDDPPDKGCSAIKFVLAVYWGLSRTLLTRKWNAWKAILKNKYFDSPWSIISLIAAFVLLVLTCIQSFYAIYAYYRPRS